MNSLGIRVVSAAVAFAIIVVFYVIGEHDGLAIVAALIVVKAQHELSRILFPGQRHKELIFFGLCLWLSLASYFYLSFSGLFLSFASICFVGSMFFLSRKEESISPLLRDISVGVMGMVYLGIFPVFTILPLRSADGLWWFVTTLAIVFAGDTCAYFSGIAFGKRKVMAQVSPKKTWSGVFGGLTGSLVVGLVCWKLFFSYLHPGLAIALPIVAGCCSQAGDFFESLLKRIANLKDSGAIMPGHGGALDRIDGVLFAGPVVYLVFSY